MKPKLKKCWLVWGRHHGLPNKSHDTKEAATLEAWRWAVKIPGRSFLVMEAVDVRKFVPVATEEK